MMSELYLIIIQNNFKVYDAKPNPKVNVNLVISWSSDTSSPIP
jgi:hypothetical protein